MVLKIRRVILFARDVGSLARFYRDVMGLEVLEDQASKGWVEFNAGSCSLALHHGRTKRTGRREPKVVFGSRDVQKSRRMLIRRGAKLGKVKRLGVLHLCDGKDPEGNSFQISNRP